MPKDRALRLTRRVAVVLSLASMFIFAACDHPSDKHATSVGESKKQIGPFLQCRWVYKNGIEPLKNSAVTPGFDRRYNPFITVSRRGLTARVVGVLSDATLNRFGGSLESVVQAYPYLTPVKYTARHHVRPEDILKPAAWREGHPAGEIDSTEVIELPPNSVMIIYPIAIAMEGLNTAAGNWAIFQKDRGRPNDASGEFGRFPFLKYTVQGHALHGPTESDATETLWALRRGKVSHGCNRMEGEHSVELSVMLGCPASGASRTCGPSNELVTVMEEFDYIPDPKLTSVTTGIISSYSEIYTHWVSPDVANFPRDATYPLPAALKNGDESVLLQKTLNKEWSAPLPAIAGKLNGMASMGVVRQRSYPTWDNRDTQGSKQQFVVGEECEKSD